MMRATGVTRKIDALGRVVIPREILKNLDILLGDPMEFFVEDDKIIVKKYEPKNTCVISGVIADDNINICNGKIILSKKIAGDIAREIQKELKNE